MCLLVFTTLPALLLLSQRPLMNSLNNLKHRIKKNIYKSTGILEANRKHSLLETGTTPPPRAMWGVLFCERSYSVKGSGGRCSLKQNRSLYSGFSEVCQRELIQLIQQ